MKWESPARVTDLKGLYFEEEDILMLEELHQEDLRIDLSFEYHQPGFGILMAGEGVEYLLRIGHGFVNVYEKDDWGQREIYYGAINLFPEGQDVLLRFEKLGHQIMIYDEYYELLMAMQLPKELDRYRIGYYSTKGNRILKTEWRGGTPLLWHTSIHNTNGGIVSFFQHGFNIRNSDRVAEIERQKVFLKKGTYYFSAEITGDIVPYVFLSANHHLTVDLKNLLNDEGGFTLDNDTQVNILFRGRHGSAKNIAIKLHKEDRYLPTQNEAREISESFISVEHGLLSNLVLDINISGIPKSPTEGHILGSPMALSFFESGLKINTIYRYTFDFDESVLWVTDENDNTVFQSVLDLSEERIELFRNLTGTITHFHVEYIYGEDLDVIHHDTVRQFIPSAVQGPITIVDEYDNPLSLSASYRQWMNDVPTYYFTNWEREYFLPGEPVTLQHKVLDDSMGYIRVRKVPKGQPYDLERIYDADEGLIHDLHYFAKQTEVIAPATMNYHPDRGNIILDADEEYEILVVDYLKKDSFAINYQDFFDAYQVEIATRKDTIELLYDYSEHASGYFIPVNEQLDEGGYLVLSRTAAQ